MKDVVHGNREEEARKSAQKERDVIQKGGKDSAREREPANKILKENTDKPGERNIRPNLRIQIILDGNRVDRDACTDDGKCVDVDSNANGDRRLDGGHQFKNIRSDLAAIYIDSKHRKQNVEHKRSARNTSHDSFCAKMWHLLIQPERNGCNFRPIYCSKTSIEQMDYTKSS